MVRIIKTFFRSLDTDAYREGLRKLVQRTLICLKLLEDYVEKKISEESFLQLLFQVLNHILLYVF